MTHRSAIFCNSVKTIAIVGASPKPDRDSHSVLRYMRGHKYDVVVAVNPGQVRGVKLHGVPRYRARWQTFRMHDLD